MNVAATLVFCAVPAAVIFLSHRIDFIRRIGVIVICYGLGMAVSFAGLLPAAAREAAPMLSELTVILALPLLLFSLDLRQLYGTAGRALLSLACAISAVTGIATGLFFYIGGTDAAYLAAMSVGVYSGGTPNLAAIKTGLGIPDPLYLAFHSLDAVTGALYFLFMLTAGVPLFRRLLGGRKLEGAAGSPSHTNVPDEDDYTPFLVPQHWASLALALLLSVAVAGVSLGIATLLAPLTGGQSNSAVLIIAITTLSLALSLLPRVRALTLSYRAGMYLIYVFCLAVAALVSPEELARLDATVATFLLIVVFGSLAVHATLCRLAGVDGDTFLVTSVAAVASPPFVPLMARALNNPGAMLPGMTAGVVGYAVGSYLGISLGLLLLRL